jgi:hypothetical protein
VCRLNGSLVTRLSEDLEGNPLSFIPVARLLSQLPFQNVMRMDFHVKMRYVNIFIDELDIIKGYIGKELRDGLNQG